jgi:hypothetical protein
MKGAIGTDEAVQMIADYLREVGEHNAAAIVEAEDWIPDNYFDNEEDE